MKFFLPDKYATLSPLPHFAGKTKAIVIDKCEAKLRITRQNTKYFDRKCVFPRNEQWKKTHSFQLRKQDFYPFQIDAPGVFGSGKFAERAQNVLIIVYLIIMEPFFMSSR